MRTLISLSILAISCTHVAASETKQWFNNASYTDHEHAKNSQSLSSHYYFAPQQHSGVWDDFGYLDTDTNIALSYVDSGSDSMTGVSAEGFYGNWFGTISAPDLSESDNRTVGLGYLYNDALKVSISHNKLKYGSDFTLLQAQYNHQINESDYVGFTAVADDELDNWDISSRYFAHLKNDSFFALDVSHSESDQHSTTSIFADYYFTRNVALGVGKTGSYESIQAKYFFNNTYYLKAKYTKGYGSSDIIAASFTAQF